LRKFNAYQLAKYNRDGKVKLRDVLFLTHASRLMKLRPCYGSSLLRTSCHLRTPGKWSSRLVNANKRHLPDC
jgi:hypothetical protein